MKELHRVWQNIESLLPRGLRVALKVGLMADPFTIHIFVPDAPQNASRTLIARML